MSEIQFDNLGAADYDRAKTVLNKAKHPGFIGRELFFRCATTGIVCVAVIDGVDCGVAMVAKGKLQALSIIASGQGKGVGSALMRRLQPEWVSAIAERISFFERLGYKSLGAPKVGQNGKHATQLMQRGEMPEGTDSAASAQNAPQEMKPSKPEAPPLTLLSDLADESPRNRSLAQLSILDGLIERAILAERFDSAVKLLDAANEHFLRIDRERRKHGET